MRILPMDMILDFNCCAVSHKLPLHKFNLPSPAPPLSSSSCLHSSSSFLWKRTSCLSLCIKPSRGVAISVFKSSKRRFAFGLSLLGAGLGKLVTTFSSMAWLSSARSCADLVSQLKSYGIITHPRVAHVMSEIDRGLFVSGYNPYVDTPQPIGYNATISAPHMHALCLELLEPHLQPGMRALDIGSGTGYLTACFALMVGELGRAVGVEHIPELVEKSIVDVKRSKAAHLLEKGSLSIHAGDGREGWASLAPYDAIHVGAAAVELPQQLIDQLKPGGRLVIPVGKFFQELKVIDKHSDGSITESVNTQVRYVPLTSKESQLHGEF